MRIRFEDAKQKIVGKHTDYSQYDGESIMRRILQIVSDAMDQLRILTNASNEETTKENFDDHLNILQNYFRDLRQPDGTEEQTQRNHSLKISPNRVEQPVEQFLLKEARLKWIEESAINNSLRSFVIDICKAKAEDPFFVYAFTYVSIDLSERFIFICKRMPMQKNQYFCLDLVPLINRHKSKIFGSGKPGETSQPPNDSSQTDITLYDIFWMPLDQALLTFSLDYSGEPYFFICLVRLDKSVRTFDGQVFPHFGFIDLTKPFSLENPKANSKSKVEPMLDTHVVELQFEDPGRIHSHEARDTSGWIS